MRLVENSGNDRIADELRQCLTPQATLDIASSAFSLFAFGELSEALTGISKARLALPADRAHDLVLLGTAADRPFRNRLHARWLAKQCAEWIEKKTEVRHAAGAIPQATLIAGDANGALKRVITGACAFTTEGLGITPGNQFSLIQSSESAEECTLLSTWFETLWNSLPTNADGKVALRSHLKVLSDA